MAIDAVGVLANRHNGDPVELRPISINMYTQYGIYKMTISIEYEIIMFFLS